MINPSGSFLRAAGSLWLTAVLLLLLLVAMAFATAYESVQGTEAALTQFYRTRWFAGLIGLLGINLLASLVNRYPYNRRQVGFVLTHVSILAVIVGAWVTRQWGIDGQVSIQEGATEREFTIHQDSLTLARADDEGKASVELDADSWTQSGAVERPPVPVLSFSDLKVQVETYLPNSMSSQEMKDDNPQENTAVEVRLSNSQQAYSGWVTATGEPSSLGPLRMAMRNADSLDEYDRLVRNSSASQPSGLGTVQVEVKGESFKLPLERCMEDAMPLGNSGYTVKVLRYIPHATVNKDRKLVSLSEQPVNPAIEAELTGAEGTFRRLAFARFPEFSSMHKIPEGGDVKLTLVTAVSDIPTVPLEIVKGPEGKMAVRFTTDKGEIAVRELEVGVAVDSPWMDFTCTILRRYDHARLERVVVLKEGRDDDASPAVLLTVTMPDRTEKIWLRKYDSQILNSGGVAYKLSYSDQSRPLGLSVTLNQFRVGRYPGTERPRSFESHVTFLEPVTGREQSWVISMNHPASVGGYTFYQSSYHADPNGGGKISVLSVSWDPGQPIVFCGYIGMLLGMLWVVGMRMADRRRILQRNADGNAISGNRECVESI